jgi:hypothetical protein
MPTPIRTATTPFGTFSRQTARPYTHVAVFRKERSSCEENVADGTAGHVGYITSWTSKPESAEKLQDCGTHYYSTITFVGCFPVDEKGAE